MHLYYNDKWFTVKAQGNDSLSSILLMALCPLELIIFYREHHYAVIGHEFINAVMSDMYELVGKVACPPVFGLAEQISCGGGEAWCCAVLPFVEWDKDAVSF